MLAEDADNAENTNPTDTHYYIVTSADINDDGIVEILDLTIIGLAFGTQPSDLLWNPDADVTNDGIVNIFDLATIGRNYGKTS